MAFGAGSNIGSGFSTTANQASLLLTISGAGGSINELIVLIVAVDNAQTTTGASTAVSGVTSSVANTWTRAVGFANAPGGVAQAGADISIWYSRLTAAIPSGGTITATFANATLSDAAAMTAARFTMSAAPQIEATNTLADTAAAVGSLDAITSNIECLRVRAIASEGNTGAGLVQTTGWTPFAVARSGTGTADTEMEIRGEWRIATGTSFPSAPTGGAGVTDHASAYVAFKETGVVPVSSNKDNFFLVM